MNTYCIKSFLILRSLNRNETAYKAALKIAIAAGSGTLNIASPLFELVKHYKSKVVKLRNELKELK